jgi:hypothetical protein
VSQELVWLWDKDNSGAQELELQPLKAGTGGLVKEHQIKKTKFVCSELQKNCDISIAL